MYIFGLGNPGRAYTGTPHNAGYIILDEIAQRSGCDWQTDRPMQAHRSRCGDWVLVKPYTYMNRSGESLRPLLNDQGSDVVARDLVVAHDDVDLPLGTLKIVAGRGTGGHRGVASIERALGTRDFTRIKIGVAPVDEEGVMRKPHGNDLVKGYLLSPMGTGARDAVAGLAPTVEEILRCIERDGVPKAMSLYNRNE